MSSCSSRRTIFSSFMQKQTKSPVQFQSLQIAGKLPPMAAYPRPSENNGSVSRNSSRPALSVVPLNSMPYVGALPRAGENPSLPTDVNTHPVSSQPVVLLAAEPTPEDLKKILDSVKGTVVLTGSAATGVMGPHMGKMNISETNDSYQFRISLPGVLRDEQEFSCDIDYEGKVIIKGLLTTGEQIVCKNGLVFQMLTHNLGPPGRFSLAFNLPGPVDHLQFAGKFVDGGILKGVVKKLQP